ncbi:stage III sporulation protein AB [Paratissierella segnis]|jgi:stage III sporulation protein AB|uniref:Stage III sporulation protein AB n=1 Tax=Paratissierella segnis TaxID=2763679 RepID=A0A926EUE7_9FIRM|nr:stage III sporulation protein AB [Paratissierella segnis]MBC8588443.1 stage III sporulation protein AB [Paratissierella segnis]
MFFIKASLFILIFITSTSLGFLYGKKYSKRVENLIALQQGIRILQSEIIIFSNPLPEALKNTSNKVNKQIAKIFLIIRDSLLKNHSGDIYYSFLVSEIYLKDLFFRKEDIDLFLSLGKMIGKTNRLDQEKQFNYLLVELETLITEAKEDRKKNEKMYRSLGLLLGLGIIIILI